MKHLRTWRRAIVTAVCLAVVSLAVLTVTSRIAMPKNNQDAVGMIEASANGVMGEPDDTIDALIIGDSEAFSALSPLHMWNEQGITSYTCSSIAQRLCYSRTLLQRALTRQHPKVVVLETDCFFYPFSVADALKREVQNAFPVFEYHDRWKSLQPQDFVETPRQTWTDSLKGFRLNCTVDPVQVGDYMKQTEVKADLPLINRLYVEDIARICAARDIRLVLLSVPSAHNMSDTRHSRIQKIADRLKIDYIDMNTGDQRIDIDWSRDTRDRGDHMNLYGAQKVSGTLAKILSRDYHLPDHRADRAFSAWNDEYARYRQRVDRLVSTP